jgi:hypothetical protein
MYHLATLNFRRFVLHAISTDLPVWVRQHRHKKTDQPVLTGDDAAAWHETSEKSENYSEKTTTKLQIIIAPFYKC